MTEAVGSAQPNKINYGNSDKLRKEEAATVREPVKKIVSSGVIQQKKPLGRKIADLFTGPEAKGTISFVWTDVILPQAKGLIVDAGQTALQRAVFGDSSGRRVSNTGADRSRGTAYNRMYTPTNSQGSESSRRSMSPQARATHDFKEIILSNRGEAEEVIDGLCLMIDQYKTVSVADLYEMVGLTGEFTDQKWGWTDLRSAGVSRVREGYLLDLPKTVSLD